jgi:predicted nucleotidyltransferase
LNEVARVIRKLLPSQEYGAVLFGSRATGQARRASDWDIGIVGPRPLDGATRELIRESLDNLPTLHTLDLVDLADAPEAFREAALRSTVRLL